MYTHQIIDVVTGVRPSELRFESETEARTWLESYGVTQQYKDEHYRIVPNRDQYVMRHLDAWLDKEINGDTRRDAVREAMLVVYDTDPEYYGSQSWWNVYDRAKCDRIGEVVA